MASDGVCCVLFVLILAVFADGEDLMTQISDDFVINLNAFVNGEIVFPCKPTRPEVNVALVKDSNTINLGKQEDSNLTVEYDPTVGFTLKLLGVGDSGFYYCEASLDKEEPQSHFFHLNVQTKQSSILMSPTFNSTHGRILREGDKLHLECTALTDTSIKPRLSWKKPHGSSESIIKDEKCKDDTYDCNKIIITIQNVTFNDKGNYTCVLLNDKDGNSRENTFNITIISRNDSRIILYSLSNEIIEVKNGSMERTAKIVVIAETAGKPNYIWYGPDNKSIAPHTEKYETKSERKGVTDEIILTVLNVNPLDSGNYSLKVSEGSSSEWLNRTIIVLGKPVVFLKPSPNLSKKEGFKILYHLNSKVNFTCEVFSMAPVEIKWFMKKCDLRNTSHCTNEDNFTQIYNTEYKSVFHRKYQMMNSLFIKDQGVLQCVANNSYGNTNASLNLYVTDISNMSKTVEVFGMPNEIVEGDNITLVCAAIVYNNTKHPQWNGKGIQENTSGLKIEKSKTNFTYFSNLTFINISKQAQGLYECHNGDLGEEQALADINVLKASPPTITKTNLKDEKALSVKQGSTLLLYCYTSGKPKPTVTWCKDEELVTNDTTIQYDNELLTITVVKLEHEGIYSCIVKNRLGKTSEKGTLTITDKPGVNKTMVSIIVVCVIALAVVIIILIIRIQKERKLRRELCRAGLEHFEKGQLESINPDLPVDDQADLLPYDRKWEFPRDKLKLGKQLGAGAFGVVMKAEAWGIVPEEEKTTVAVKMVKIGADRSFIKALASELKIMTHLGKHLNVVNLLGASTKNLAKMELMVIVEFCKYGNLHNYLLRHRDHFVDQLDRTTGKINPTLGLDKPSRLQSTKSKSNLKRFLSYTNSVASGSISDQRSASSTDNTEVPVIASDMTVVYSPSGTGDSDECLLSNSSSEQPDWRVKYRGDYKESISISVCTQDLLCWAFQVSCGMEYLTSRKVLHGDLAARNILLADDKVVKICDFGLAKSMYKSDNYRKKSAGPLPVKWMALESIRDRVFSTQSDVWSFGITMWEMFTLAQTPYPGMEADERLYNKLGDGYRMEQPPYATNAIYRMMLQCWEEQPDERPSFKELREQLGAMLDDSLRQHYEKKNDLYMHLNEHNLQSDYLSMMGAPNYSNMVAPDGTQHGYVNSPELRASVGQQNYLPMNQGTSAVSPISVEGSVFEFSEGVNNTSGYLKMSGKEGIFSPGHVEDSPFQFSGDAQKERAAEMKDLNSIRTPNADNYVNMGHTNRNPASFSNPNYGLAKISSTKM